MLHTFSFKALRNPLASIVLTRESLGYKAAETRVDERAKITVNRWSSILGVGLGRYSCDRYEHGTGAGYVWYATDVAGKMNTYVITI